MDLGIRRPNPLDVILKVNLNSRFIFGQKVGATFQLLKKWLGYGVFLSPTHPLGCAI